MNYFVEGDRIKINDMAPIKAMYRGKEGVVKKWHHDGVYTVEINGICLTIFQGEMEKI